MALSSIDRPRRGPGRPRESGHAHRDRDVTRISLATLNEGDRAAFVGAVGWVFEHSPWVAERAWEWRPFTSIDTLAARMMAIVRESSHEEQRALLVAHPDLGTRARMSEASTEEQAGAGLDRLSAVQFDRLTRLNTAYRERFGYPFLFAVKGASATVILEALERRVSSEPEAEWEEALTQVARIARNRLNDVVQ
jgi:2-oxo-4-hydroxy-4-carboxy-5-ureidoimidazoline decarboxylase